MKDILQTGCLVSGILCFVYFAGIVLYAGLSEWFMCIWAAAGAGFLALWQLQKYQNLHPQSPIRFLTAAAFAVVFMAVLLLIWFGSYVIKGMAEKPAAGADYVIVLGARVRGNQPTRALRKRLDRAYAYAEENPDTIWILSGGQGADEEISEAQCMYEYLKERGMDENKMILESNSTTTQENLRFSAEFLDQKQDQVGIVSNNFHICRALLLAEKEGYQKIFGIPASSDLWMQPHYVLREICALAVIRIKEFL